MTETSTYTDEDLTAFLDGALPQKRLDAIAAAVAVDPALGARLQALRLPMGVLKADFAQLLGQAPAMPALSLPEPATAFAWRGLAAALVVGVVLGAGAWALRPQPRDWMDFVAAYQALYVPATLSDIAPTKAQATAQLADLSARLGLDLEGVQANPALQYRRGQVLGYEGALLVQLAFQSADGTPIAFCILQEPRQTAQGFAPGQREGMQTVAWARGGYGFLLIGGKDAKAIIAAAEQIDAAL